MNNDNDFLHDNNKYRSVFQMQKRTGNIIDLGCQQFRSITEILTLTKMDNDRLSELIK